ncbi:MAG: hypothetical protein HUK03_09900, partial [Bacteroidaceae bacterium]|nr:hypothetical protein [Bacteroidaceae bacterium]
DESTTEETQVVEKPVGVGQGTASHPWTVRHIINLPKDTSGWVIGYVVGEAYRSMANADFSAKGEYGSNILLSYDSLCTTTSRCIAVELNTQKRKQACSLRFNKDLFRQCLMVHGKVQTYLDKKGLRDCDASLSLKGFDISLIDPQPEEWEQDTITSWQAQAPAR